MFARDTREGRRATTRPAATSRSAVTTAQGATASLDSIQELNIPAADALQRALAAATLQRAQRRSACDADLSRRTVAGALLQRAFILPNDQIAAVQTLNSEFPSMTIEGNLDAAADAFWEKYMRVDDVPISLADFVRSLLAFLTSEQRSGMKIQLFPDAGGLIVQVNGSQPLSDRDERPLSLNQAYKPSDGRLDMKLGSIVAPFHGKLFVRSMVAQAKALNVRRLSLRASSIGGSQEGVFVWARYGYIPSAEQWSEMRGRGLTKLDEAPKHSPTATATPESVPAGGAISGELAERIRDILLDPSPLALRRLVHLSWRDKSVSPFLNQLLSSGWYWDGMLELGDDTSEAWITTYASGGTVGDDLVPAASVDKSDPRLPQIEGEDEQREPPSEEDMAYLAAQLASQTGEKERKEFVAELRDEFGQWEGIVERVLHLADQLAIK